ncbi:MAG: peptide chain release factor 1 [Actinobacteria bacterium]|nr:peptide chain release factor 1 [Actinomycetota bacterium]
MRDRLEQLEAEFEDILQQLSTQEVMSDPDQLRKIGQRHSQLEPIVAASRGLRAAEEDLEAARQMLDDAKGDERDELRAEIDSARKRIGDKEEELKLLLLPRDPNDERAVIFEIRGTEGGEEANLFAKDLFDMYTRYADQHRWKMEILSVSHSDRGGLDEVTFKLSGDGAWSRMKFEGGVHRVQRVPVTESQGRIHTSAATVTVLPEADEIDLQINPNDLRVDVYRSSGPGGQSVNTTDSAVRITHLPTGIVVAMQDEKSQIQNRARALVVLRARLLKEEQDRVGAEMSEQKRSQTGSGGRSEKIRTYNYKDNRVTDHRIGLTLHKLDKVLLGDLDDLHDALISEERARQLSEGGTD